MNFYIILEFGATLVWERHALERSGFLPTALEAIE